MSFPNIPDITPKIDISLEDATNLLLASIALEEISLSKLIDAESCKIKHVLHGCEHKESSIEDALQINDSVDDTIKNIIKLQMLLQFKLEKVQELIPTTTTTSTTTTSTTTTTTSTRTTTSTSTTTTSTRTTTSATTFTCSTTKKNHHQCGLTGKGKGFIDNCEDIHHSKIAELKVFITKDVKNRTLSYTVQNDSVELYLFASNFNIKIECCCHETMEVFVFGKGSVDFGSKCESKDKTPVKFVLRVLEDCFGNKEFVMIITSVEDKRIIHNSGTVKVSNKDSRSMLEICCS